MCHFLPVLFCLPLLIYKCYEMYFKGNTFQVPRYQLLPVECKPTRAGPASLSKIPISNTVTRCCEESTFQRQINCWPHAKHPWRRNPWPPSEQRGKTKVGALTWNGELISTVPHGSPLSPEWPAVADFRVTTRDTRTMHKGPEADAFPVVSCNIRSVLSTVCTRFMFFGIWKVTP